MDTLVERVAASLRSLFQDPHDGDRAIWLMATLFDRHLVDSLSPLRTGRWAGEAADALMAMLPPPLQVELERHLAEQGTAGTVSGDETAPCHLSMPLHIQPAPIR